MDVKSVNPVRNSIERPEPVPSNKKGQEKIDGSSSTSKEVAVSSADLDNAVDFANETGQMLNRKLNFAVDESTDKVVVKIVDEESGELVRQVPASEMLRISAHLKKLRDMNDQVMGAVKSVILDVKY